MNNSLEAWPDLSRHRFGPRLILRDPAQAVGEAQSSARGRRKSPVSSSAHFEGRQAWYPGRAPPRELRGHQTQFWGHEGDMVKLRANEQKSACWYGLRPSFVDSPRCDSLGGLKGTALSKSLECPTNIKGDLGGRARGGGEELGSIECPGIVAFPVS